MRTSKAMLAEVASSEGPGPRVYNDGAGVPTVGHGHTGRDVPGTGWWVKGQDRRWSLTAAEQRALLAKDISLRYEPYVNTLIRSGVKLTQGQFDALVSLVYNCGGGAVQVGSTIGDALRRGDYDAASAGFLLWSKARKNGSGPPVVWPGLLARRKRERALFDEYTIPPYMTGPERELIRKLFDWRRREANIAGRKAAVAALRVKYRGIRTGTRANRAKRRAFIRKVAY